MMTVGCMANRQIARKLDCAPSTIDRLISRLGRHCLLFHQQFGQSTRTEGPVVVDGFESFELSQYFPFHHHVAVEVATGFFPYFTDSPLRRKGRMTDRQKRRRAELEDEYGRPDPRAIRKDMAELLQVILRDRDEATVFSDEHRSYRWAIRQVDCAIEHEVTNSKERRDRWNLLWEVNLLELWIRHSSANHKRETIAWSKRRQSSAERLAIMLVWRNYVQPRREKRCRQTPAMLKGLCDRALTVKDVLAVRLFRTRLELPARWSDYYARRVRTPALGVNLGHELKYAF